ncbi:MULTISPECIES: hypothetical protein [unclassified Flavobacterium]|uniref:hypothetical protein n=1 Tax=unclassified Flavobacterium TaxID=196869 RepID=UPI00086A1AC9|nr:MULTISPECIES: hypothetical protein [unclassified Flavobacterium]MBN9285640.1 hypothetical protein [Flavobacterium sp.]ODS91932.1 MAG: hypothetical protein ABS44_00095 [Chryseobacterium sp. SCN 40-13]OJV71004.1 MAG: hypothetical protein BGO42_04110 [Flavobacterium sp. 40-81]
MKILDNLLLIINESYRWRKRELLISKKNEETESKKLSLFGVLKNNILYFIMFGSITYFFPNLINSDLAGYLINALSIFVGLFTSVLILFFDKYLTHKANIQSSKEDNESVLLEKIKVKNFSTRFVFITLETILIAVVLIGFLSSPLVFKDFFKEDVKTYYFKFENNNAIILFLGLSIIYIIKSLTLLLFYKLLSRLLFIFGSLGEYMFSVFNNKIKKI